MVSRRPIRISLKRLFPAARARTVILVMYFSVALHRYADFSQDRRHQHREYTRKARSTLGQCDRIY